MPYMYGYAYSNCKSKASPPFAAASLPHCPFAYWTLSTYHSHHVQLNSKVSSDGWHFPCRCTCTHISRSFSFDLNLKEGHAGYDVLYNAEKPLGLKGIQGLEHEASSTGSTGILTAQQQNALAAKKKSKAMTMATAPGQQIFMNAFMMYMSGKNLNIFSISVTSMAILSPLKGILNMEKTFGQLGEDLQIQKLIFVALNLLWFAGGLYKLSIMRLIPTTSADWTGSVVWKEMMETTSIPPEAFYSSSWLFD